jgi:hypothetical protein
MEELTTGRVATSRKLQHSLSKFDFLMASV